MNNSFDFLSILEKFSKKDYYLKDLLLTETSKFFIEEFINIIDSGYKLKYNAISDLLLYVNTNSIKYVTPDLSDGI